MTQEQGTVEINALDDQGFLDQVILSGKPSLVLFGDSTCRKCQIVLFKVLGWLEASPKNLSFYFVEFRQAQKSAALVNVTGAPTVLLMVGKEVFGALAGTGVQPNDLDELYGTLASAKLPSVARRVLNFFRAIQRAVKERKAKAPKALIDARREACKGCHFNKENSCSACGCFIPWKSAWASESCPKGFWPKS